MGKHTGELVLGIIGGVLGLIMGTIALFVGGINSAFGGGETVVGLGFAALLLSVLGIVGAAFVNSKTKVAGWFMLIAGIGGFISISLFYLVPGIMFIIGGLMALLRKDKKKDKKKK